MTINKDTGIKLESQTCALYCVVVYTKRLAAPCTNHTLPNKVEASFFCIMMNSNWIKYCLRLKVQKKTNPKTQTKTSPRLHNLHIKQYYKSVGP